MPKINWIHAKPINFLNVEKHLHKSIQTNQLTNYGPVTIKLEQLIREKLQIESDRSVIVTCNGAAALHALAAGLCLSTGKKLTFATQAFTFPSAAQGFLDNSQIVDIDSGGGLDLNLVDSNTVDGIIVTNVFGMCTDIQKYVDWCDKHSKFLLFDNATGPFTFYHGKNINSYGTGSIISLHHTKPIGFAEGGAIIVEKRFESYIRKCINFGFEVNDGKVKWSPFGSNYKMSEISAACLYEYIFTNFDLIIKHNQNLIQLLQDRLKDVEGVELYPNFSDSEPVVSCIPVLFSKPINEKHMYQLELNGICVRKYYTPLKDFEKSASLFERILCFPCNLDVDSNTIELYIDLIKQL